MSHIVLLGDSIFGDYLNVASNVIFGALGLLLVRRHVRCWRNS